MSTAGHDITVGSAVTFMERHAKRLDESSTTNHGSAVAVGGNLTMTAGNDLTVAGSTVVAQNNAVLAAARNLSVTQPRKIPIPSTCAAQNLAGWAKARPSA